MKQGFSQQEFALKLFAPLMLVGAVACSNETEAPREPGVRPAKLVTVEAASNRRSANYPAVIRAARSSELTFQVGGQIEELAVIESQEVEQGAVIARLDQRDFVNSLAQSRSQFENTEAEYQRARRLVAQDAISRSVLEGRKSQRDIARAALDTAEKALSDTVLKAPFSGGVARVYVEQFQNVQPQEAVVSLQSSGVEAIIHIPASVVAFVPQFKPISTKVILDAAPGVPIPAEFKEASGQADPNTQTYEVSFTFTPPEDLLILPGMTATLQSFLELNNGSSLATNGVSAPLAAIVAEGDEKFVWIVDPDEMTVSKRIITVGDSVGENIAIVSGLKSGETIVAAGGSYLHEGMKVRSWVN